MSSFNKAPGNALAGNRQVSAMHALRSNEAQEKGSVSPLEGAAGNASVWYWQIDVMSASRL